jgi:RNA polymerase sigma-32 factor
MINWKACKPLSDADLHDTACLAVAGNTQAIEKLVRSNVKLASSLAHSYKDFDGMNVEDLTSEALIGLIESIPTFDTERGTKFTTYASWRMRMRVLNFVLDNFRLVRIGTTQAQKKIFWRLNRETEALRKEGIDVTEQALADRLEVKTREIREMQIRMGTLEASLDAPISTGEPRDGYENDVTLFGITDSGEETPEQYTTNKRMIAWVQARMVEFEQRLTGNDLAVWNHRIAAEEPLTLQEVGKLINTSRQYVSQTEKRLQTAFEKYARNKARD